MPSTPLVRVLGLSLAVNACSGSASPPVSETPPLPGNPPLPVEEPPLPTANPPAPSDLPTWDQVESGHPRGATNPPRPLLVVSREPEACFKDWVGGMMPPDPQEYAINGRVVPTAADGAAQGTQIQCPEGQPAALLAAHAAWSSGAKTEDR